MSLSPHQRGNIKQNIDAIVDLGQNSGDIFYNVGIAEQTNISAAGRSEPALQNPTVFKPDKAFQTWGHYQQSNPVKWVHQDPVHASTWFRNATKVPENFVAPSGRMDDPRSQGLPNVNREMQQEKMVVGSSVPFSQAPVSGMEWQPHTMDAMQHGQFVQQHQKPGDASYQPQSMCHIIPDSTLQSFQVAFGPTKKLQAPRFLQTFQSVGGPQNLPYESQKSQQQILQPKQMQHFQQQQQPQQQQRHQIHQQFPHQQKMQEQIQQQLKVPQRSSQTNLQDRPAKQQPDNSQAKAESNVVTRPTQEPSPYLTNTSVKPPAEPQEPQLTADAPPRRSRRLSKDGISPTSKELASNGSIGGFHVPTGGVIHSTQRRRRTSKEINLETLAQKASEMESLPAKVNMIKNESLT